MKTDNKVMLRVVVLIFCLSVIPNWLLGQGLDAYFTMSNLSGNAITRGCQPLVVQFTDSSTFNGNPLPYSNTNNGDPFDSHTWDFGLGLAGSNQQNPSIAYSSADTVDVQLYVTNNGVDYDTFSRELIIHPRPTVNFSASVRSGCDSLEVTFTDLTTSGGLPIVDWTWDFSDGTVSKDTNPTHTFVLDPNSPQFCYNITLIVVNSEGCNNSLTRNSYICIDPPPVANFTVDNTLLCDTPYTVQFTDLSTSNNGLSYLWRFGSGGQTSTLQNPEFTYPNPGSFNVRLTVTDTTCGETGTRLRNNYIRAQSTLADYTFSPDSVCAGTPITFTSNHQLSNGSVANSFWDFGDNNTSTQLNPTHTYTDGGVYYTSVRITDNFGCSDTFAIADSILIYDTPDVTFTSNVTQSCRAPFDVSFSSTVSANVQQYEWDFGDNETSTQANPTHIYTSPGNYTVTLTVTSDDGCTNSFTRNNWINIEPTVVGFEVDTNLGCIPLTVQFTDISTSNDPITAYSWNFDDPGSGPQNTSTAQNPNHTFNDVGTFDVTLTIETQSGCVGDFTLPISTGNNAFAAFSANPTTVCVNEPVGLSNNSTGNITSTLWTFGDSQTSNDPNESSHIYEAPGTYDLTLRVGDNGCFSDSTIEITVLDPLAEFDFTAVCSTPGRINFTSTGTGGTSFTWDFDDNGATANGQNVSHTFSNDGTYNVELTVFDSNTGCSDEISVSVNITTTPVDFSSNNAAGCAPHRVNFTNLSGTGLTYLWNFGNPASGNANTNTGRNPNHRYNAPGVYTVSLTVTDQNGCQYTETKNAFVTISGANANFNAQQTFSCFDPNSPNTINFNDQSNGLVGSSITEWTWYFGDGNTATYSIPGNPPPSPVSYTYATPGVYDVALAVTNNLGCTDSIMREDYIDISNPVANFSLAFNLFCDGQPVGFTNQSTGTGLSYFWDFGDNVPGDNSTLRNPQYTYSDTGLYNVSLVITDIYGCTDSITRDSIVKIGTPQVDFIADDTFRYCPPHLVNFTNFSSYDTVAISSVLWSFGDGTFSNRFSPSHIYTQSGLFDVSLFVQFDNGCSDTLSFPNLINVGGAVGTVDLSVDTGCTPLCIDLDANSEGAISHFWLYGDGNQESGTRNTSHCYLNPGLFVPAVVLTDTQQPTCTYVLYSNDTLRADSVTAFFLTDLDTVCQRSPVNFTDSSYAEINNNFISWNWDFGDGNTDTVQNPVYSYSSGGTYTVSLIAENGYGCVDIFSKEIFVWEKARADFVFTDSIGCDVLFTTAIDQSIPGDAPIVDWFWEFEQQGTFNVQNPPAVTYNDTGTYEVSLYVTDANGCIDSLTKSVTIFLNPPGIDDLDTIKLCLGDTMELRGVPGYFSYEWSPNIWISDTTIANPLAYPQDTITYQLVTTDTTGCFTVDSITIEVLPRPELTVQPYPDTVICFGDTIGLLASGSADTYSWQPRDYMSNGIIANPLVYPPVSTTFRVIATDSNNCRNFDSVRVRVNTFDMNIYAPRTCLGDTSEFADNIETTELPIVDWNWTIDNPKFANPLTFTDSSFTYLFADSGDYSIDLIVSDAIGCQDTLSANIIIDHPTEPFAEQDTLICFGQSTSLRGGGGVEIFWTPPVSIDDEFSFNPIVTPLQSTEYVANLRNGVCPIGRDSIFVTVIPTPYLEVPGDKEVLRGTSVEIEVFAESPRDTLYWNPSDSLTCSDCLVTRAFPDQTTTYTVSVVDTFGCINEKEVLVNVFDKCNDDIVFVANTFTPNEDGRNDQVFARRYGAAQINYFRIFDRWGKLVFETTNENIGWDGLSSNGKKHNQGVYVYIVEAVCYSGETIVKTGNITLIK